MIDVLHVLFCFLKFISNLDQLLEGDMEPGMFSSIALNSQGLIAGGVDGCLRTIRVDNNGIKINDVRI